MRQIAVSAAVALVLLAAGPFVLRVADGLAITANVSSYLVATLVGAGIFALCVPSFVGMWLGIRKLSRLFVERAMESRARRFRAAETVLGDMLGLATALLIAAWSLPLVFDILALGGILNPIPWAAAALALAFAGREVRHIHAALTRSVESSMLGGEDADATTTGTPPRP
ncbi:MAG: hypothetical protein FJ318_10260 [SAR202 cluster bacterium]|nr:hypothetical protein [SAR202 cluster bacterium]